jgi:hypothetical protein
LALAVNAGLRLVRTTRLSERTSLREDAGRRETGLEEPGREDPGLAADRDPDFTADFADTSRPFRKFRDAAGLAFRKFCEPFAGLAVGLVAGPAAGLAEWPFVGRVAGLEEWPLPFE